MKLPKQKMKNLFFVLVLLSSFFPLKGFKVQAAEYQYEEVSFYTYNEAIHGAMPVFRFYSSKAGDHLYTPSSEERDRLISSNSDYKYEGVAFFAYDSQKNGSVPVYRFYSSKAGDHFLTPSVGERDRLINSGGDYKYEGIAFYAYDTPVDDSFSVYRFYNTSGDHFYTSSTEEKDRLINIYAPNNFGPDITVGLWSYTRDELRGNPFKIEANKDYVVKDNNCHIIATLSGNTITKVTYDGDKNLKIYNSVNDTLSYRKVYFEAADGNNREIIFNVHKPESGLDEYRGKIKLQHSEDTRLTWVINTLPLEHYVWGDGELTGTGDADHNRVMVTSFRTYGYWKLLYSTKYVSEGFKVNATPGNQLYKGYSYEAGHSRIKQAAEDTRGKVVMYNNDVAITPYSSWTDGRTRSFKERWGSDNYPWCQSVDDPYGNYNGDYWNNSYKDTNTLVAEGNHMVGLSAHGSLTLANEKGWNWERILLYYFDGIDIESIY